MNETHDLNKQSTIDPHPYDMPPAERAAYANGYGQGKREAAAEIASLRAELAKEKSDAAEILGDKIKLLTDVAHLRATAAQNAILIERMVNTENRLRAELAEVRADVKQESSLYHTARQAAARRDAETIARLREALQRIERESVDDVSRADARAALSTAADQEEP